MNTQELITLLRRHGIDDTKIIDIAMEYRVKSALGRVVSTAKRNVGDTAQGLANVCK